MMRTTERIEDDEEGKITPIGATEKLISDHTGESQLMASMLNDATSDVAMPIPAASLCRLRISEKGQNGLSTRHQTLELEYMIKLYAAKRPSQPNSTRGNDLLDGGLKESSAVDMEAECRQVKTQPALANTPSTRADTPSSLPSRDATPRHRFLKSGRPQSSRASTPISKKVSRPSTAGPKLSVCEEGSIPDSKPSVVPPRSTNEATPKSPWEEKVRHALRPHSAPQGRNQTRYPKVSPFSSEWMHAHLAPEGSPRRICRFPQKISAPAWSQAWRCPSKGTRQKVRTLRSLSTTHREISKLARTCHLRRREWDPILDISEDQIAYRILQKLEICLQEAAEVIQKAWLAHSFRQGLRDYRAKKLFAVWMIQKFFRTILSNWRMKGVLVEIRKQKAAIIQIQKSVRGYIARRNFGHAKLRWCVESQLLGFDSMKEGLREHCAIAIQRAYIRYRARQHPNFLEKYIQAIVELQLRWRAYYQRKSKADAGRAKKLMLTQKAYNVRKTITNVVAQKKTQRQSPFGKQDSDKDTMRESVFVPGDSPQSKHSGPLSPEGSSTAFGKYDSCSSQGSDDSDVGTASQQRTVRANIITTVPETDVLQTQSCDVPRNPSKDVPRATVAPSSDGSPDAGSHKAMVTNLLDSYEFSMDARDEARMQGWPPQAVYGDYFDRAQLLKGMNSSHFSRANPKVAEEQDKVAGSRGDERSRKLRLSSASKDSETPRTAKLSFEKPERIEDDPPRKVALSYEKPEMIQADQARSGRLSSEKWEMQLIEVDDDGKTEEEVAMDLKDKPHEDNKDSVSSTLSLRSRPVRAKNPGGDKDSTTRSASMPLAKFFGGNRSSPRSPRKTSPSEKAPELQEAELDATQVSAVPNALSRSRSRSGSRPRYSSSSSTQVSTDEKKALTDAKSVEGKDEQTEKTDLLAKKRQSMAPRASASQTHEAMPAAPTGGRKSFASRRLRSVRLDEDGTLQDEDAEDAEDDGSIPMQRPSVRTSGMIVRNSGMIPKMRVSRPTLSSEPTQRPLVRISGRRIPTLSSPSTSKTKDVAP